MPIIALQNPTWPTVEWTVSVLNILRLGRPFVSQRRGVSEQADVCGVKECGNGCL